MQVLGLVVKALQAVLEVLKKQFNVLTRWRGRTMLPANVGKGFRGPPEDGTNRRDLRDWKEGTRLATQARLRRVQPSSVLRKQRQHAEATGGIVRDVASTMSAHRRPPAHSQPCSHSARHTCACDGTHAHVCLGVAHGLARGRTGRRRQAAATSPTVTRVDLCL